MQVVGKLIYIMYAFLVLGDVVNYKIVTDKVVINGRKCRVIKGFEGFPMRQDLPCGYGCGKDEFVYLEENIPVGYHVFDGKEMDWTSDCLNHDVLRLGTFNIDVGDYMFTGVQTCSVWTEEKFQEIVAYIKKAMIRLDDMIRESWSGEETVEI